MTPKVAGRITGLIYLGVVATGIFTLAWAPSQLFFDDDAAATAASLIRQESLLRASVYAGLLMCAFFLTLPFAFSRFLSVYGKNAARLMILFVVASIPFSLFALAQKWDILGLIAEGAAEPASVAASLDGYKRWMHVASIFWGLWLAPLGWLILKSGAVPRALGVFLILGCFEYLADYFGPMLYGGYAESAFRSWMSYTSSIGELGTCLWLLAMGAREPMGRGV